MRKQGRNVLAVAAAAVLSVAPAFAQTMEVDLRVRLATPDGAPIAGALVALIDSARVVREGVSDENGIRSLRAPRGSYRIRVRRIGFLPFLSEPLTVASGSEIELRVESSRVALETIVVTSRSRCGPIEPGEQILATVWDEIAKALRTSQLSAGDFADYAHAFVYRKKLNQQGKVISSDTIFRPLGGAKPFGVLNAAALFSNGFVVGNDRLGWIYYGPDETVLLSDQFASTHCFQVIRDPGKPGKIGIEFTPVPGRTMGEIKGVLWVDQSTAELRELIFRYVNAGLMERFRAGGFARFRRLPSGSWIVDDWALRAPILERTPGTFGDFRVAGFVEDGGGMTIRAKR